MKRYNKHTHIVANLPKEDLMLKNQMDTFCISEKELEFIKNMLQMEIHWMTEVGAPIILEEENEDGIYIIRRNFSEYEVGDQSQDNVLYVDSLSDLLRTNLQQHHILDRDITVLAWLREREYANVRYDRFYDSNEYGKQ